MPPGTASRNPPRTGLMGPRVNVMDRPTTQQGMGGIRFKPAGLSLLLQPMADDLATELRELQGQLGDYNTLVDKLNTDTDLEEVEKEYQNLKAKNATTSSNLDAMFLQRQQREASIQELERQIQDEKKQAEQLILQLDAARQEQFHGLKKENEDHLRQIDLKTKELEAIQAQYTALQDKVSRDPQKQKAMALYQRLTAVKEKRAELELALQKAELESGPQERARLLEQVKNDNLETSGMERRIADMEGEIKNLREQLAAIGGEMDAAQADKQAKFDELVKKDEEMQQFLDAFEGKKLELSNASLQAEGEITEALQRIQTLSRKDLDNMPSKQDFVELNTDLKVKQTDLKNSDSTTEA
ncbi:Intraflagellar transport protein 74, partial [Kappamyces sp. JEL0680]